MKTIVLFICLFTSYVQMFSQKTPVSQAVNLNSSRSNVNRLIYTPGLMTPENAQLMLNELDAMQQMEEVSLKMWVAANFKRFGIDSNQVKQITIYSGREFSDCTVCKQNCKGRCVQDPGADCICMYHSEPNVRVAQSERPLAIIFLSREIVDETGALDLISSTISSGRVTTVKSSKSNSSD